MKVCAECGEAVQARIMPVIIEHKRKPYSIVGGHVRNADPWLKPNGIGEVHDVFKPTRGPKE